VSLYLDRQPMPLDLFVDVRSDLITSGGAEHSWDERPPKTRT